MFPHHLASALILTSVMAPKSRARSRNSRVKGLISVPGVAGRTGQEGLAELMELKGPRASPAYVSIDKIVLLIDEGSHKGLRGRMEREDRDDSLRKPSLSLWTAKLGAHGKKERESALSEAPSANSFASDLLSTYQDLHHSFRDISRPGVDATRYYECRFENCARG